MCEFLSHEKILFLNPDFFSWMQIFSLNSKVFFWIQNFFFWIQNFFFLKHIFFLLNPANFIRLLRAKWAGFAGFWAVQPVQLVQILCGFCAGSVRILCGFFRFWKKVWISKYYFSSLCGINGILACHLWNGGETYLTSPQAFSRNSIF